MPYTIVNKIRMHYEVSGGAPHQRALRARGELDAAGEGSPPTGFSRALARTIRRAKLVTLPVGGHGFFIEQADAFNRTLVRFLRGVRAK